MKFEVMKQRISNGIFIISIQFHYSGFYFNIRYSLFDTCAELWLVSETELSLRIHYSNLIWVWLVQVRYLITQDLDFQ